MIPFSVDPTHGNIYLILGRDGRKWGHLGGRSNGDEDPAITAKREYMEETIGMLGDVNLDDIVFRLSSTQPMTSKRYLSKGVTQSRYDVFVKQVPWMPDRVQHLRETLPIIKSLGEDLRHARSIPDPTPVQLALKRFTSSAEVLTVSAPSMSFSCVRCKKIQSLLPCPKTHYRFNNRLTMCKKFELGTCCMACMEEYCDRCEDSGETMIPLRMLVVLETQSIVAVELTVPVNCASWIYSRLNRYKAIQYALETKLPVFKVIRELGGQAVDMHVRAKFIEKSEVRYMSLEQVLATTQPSEADSDNWRTNTTQRGQGFFDRNRLQLNPAHAEMIQEVAKELLALLSTRVEVLLQDPYELDEYLSEGPTILLESPL